MTDIDALRDELAELCGWARRDAGGWALNPQGVVADDFDPIHPFEDGDLTALVAAWPEGWRFMIDGEHGQTWAEAWPSPSGQSFLKVGATEYEARLRLLVAVLKAQKGATK